MVQKIRADITFKDGTAAEWQLKNPVLRPGEPGIATDTARFKIGDGLTRWENLPYYLTVDDLPPGGDGQAMDRVEELSSSVSALEARPTFTFPTQPSITYWGRPIRYPLDENSVYFLTPVMEAVGDGADPDGCFSSFGVDLDGLDVGYLRVERDGFYVFEFQLNLSIDPGADPEVVDLADTMLALSYGNYDDGSGSGGWTETLVKSIGDYAKPGGTWRSGSWRKEILHLRAGMSFQAWTILVTGNDTIDNENGYEPSLYFKLQPLMLFS